jgi:hypothetical protein
MRLTLRALLCVATPFALLTAACGDDEAVLEPFSPGTAPEAGEPPAEDGEDAAGKMERAVFDMVNAERVERGLTELDWDDQLAERAREWSDEMAADGELRHQDPQAMLERVDGFTAVGENIFHASGPAPASMMHIGWMRSDGHRGNVLQEGFDRLGVGVLCHDDGEVWATQRFGRTTGADLPRPVEDTPPEEPIVTEESNEPRCSGGPGEFRIDLEPRR